MSKIRVGVLRGGPSSDYVTSLKTGGYVLKHLPEKYAGHDILIDKEGRWYFGGIQTTPQELGSKIDIFWNALHGEFGEDGELQKMLDDHQLVYTGSGRVASLLSLHKAHAKKVFLNQGIKIPYSVEIEDEGNANKQALSVFRNFPMPAMIKVLSPHVLPGIYLAKDIFGLENALREAFKYAPKVLIEEYIPGKEASTVVIEGFRGQDFYCPFPAEIIRPAHLEFYNHQEKMQGSAQKITPGYFSQKEKEDMDRMAKLAHKALGLKHYSRADFVVHPKRGVYLIEVSGFPSLHEKSNLVLSLEAVGATFPQFLEHVIERARGKK